VPIVRLHRRQRSFKQADITRAANATARAGLAVARVEVDPATGKISVIVGKPDNESFCDTPEGIIKQL